MNSQNKMDEARLIAFLDGKLSRKEVAKVETWYDESEDNRRTLEQLYVAMFAHDRLQAVKDIDPGRALVRFKARIAERSVSEHPGNCKKWVRLVHRYAAILIAAIGITSLAVYLYSQRTGWQEVIAVVETSTILPDGSTVKLKPGSTLSYPNDFADGKRLVRLDGEAFFDVTKRDGALFRVEAHRTEIVVRGTKFNYKAPGGQSPIEVVLLEGLIDFCATNQNIAVAPNQKVVYDSGDKRIVVTEVDASMEIFGTKTFECETLADVAGVLEELYGCEITFADERFSRILFSGTIARKNSLEHTLGVVALSAGLDFRIEGNRITICK
jgi:ferric-dicitrate binding protein FerR (iron transport regulator)